MDPNKIEKILKILPDASQSTCKETDGAGEDLNKIKARGKIDNMVGANCEIRMGGYQHGIPNTYRLAFCPTGISPGQRSRFYMLKSRPR
ncbi:MAG: hypothetical protein ACI97A_000404 [Planctomycetota bacterium]